MKFDIPHSLGKAEARSRINAGLPKLERHIPGGGQLESTWEGDRLDMTITAMGQKVGVGLLVEDHVIHADVAIPLMLSMMSGPISDFVKTSAEKMLAPPKSTDT
jgi:putative polyhydroxyalkanoate system protein